MKKKQMMKYKFKIKSMIVFERIKEKPFDIANTEDLYVYFYCVRMVNIDGYSQTFEEFLDECDENPDLLREFIKQMHEHNSRQMSLNPDN
jgi:hypothetical protein